MVAMKGQPRAMLSPHMRAAAAGLRVRLKRSSYAAALCASASNAHANFLGIAYVVKRVFSQMPRERLASRPAHAHVKSLGAEPFTIF